MDGKAVSPSYSVSGTTLGVAPRMLQFRGFYTLYNSEYVTLVWSPTTQAFGGVFGHLIRSA